MTYLELSQDNSCQISNLLRMDTLLYRSILGNMMPRRGRDIRSSRRDISNDFIEPLCTILLDRLSAGSIHAGCIKHLQSSLLDLSALPFSSHQRAKTNNESLTQEKVCYDVWNDGEETGGNRESSDEVIVSALPNCCVEKACEGLDTFVTGSLQISGCCQSSVTPDNWWLSHVQVRKSVV